LTQDLRGLGEILRQGNHEWIYYARETEFQDVSGICGLSEEVFHPYVPGRPLEWPTLQCIRCLSKLRGVSQPRLLGHRIPLLQDPEFFQPFVARTVCEFRKEKFCLV
jgi:hypothetical protein